MNVEQLDNLARFYDLDLDGYTEDIDLYLGLVRRCGGPVLEIGCGTGRVLRPLAARGFTVTGVDVSEEMLRRAHERLDSFGDKVRLVRADATSISLESRFSVAIVALNTMMHFVDQDDQLAVLRSIKDHLLPDGVLVIDLFNPLVHIAETGSGVVLHEYTRVDPESGCQIMKFVSQDIDEGTQNIDVVFWYDQVERDRSVRRLVSPFTMHYFTFSEVCLLLRLAGLEFEAVYGSYDLSTYTAASDRMIVMARSSDAG